MYLLSICEDIFRIWGKHIIWKLSEERVLYLSVLLFLVF